MKIVHSAKTFALQKKRSGDNKNSSQKDNKLTDHFRKCQPKNYFTVPLLSPVSLPSSTNPAPGREMMQHTRSVLKE